MPSSTEKKILAQALESEKDQVRAEGDLSGEEDVRLVAQIDLREYLQVKYNRPPGVTTMEAWNKTILSDGKHRGNTHDATFNQDLDYALWIANRKLKAPWALNFQNYVKARLRVASDQLGQGDGREGRWMERRRERDLPAKTEKSKRRSDKSQSSQDMNIEVDRTGLMTRRALLQRELQQIDELEKQAQQQSQQRPIKSEQ